MILKWHSILKTPFIWIMLVYLSSFDCAEPVTPLFFCFLVIMDLFCLIFGHGGRRALTLPSRSCFISDLWGNRCLLRRPKQRVLYTTHCNMPSPAAGAQGILQGSYSHAKKRLYCHRVFKSDLIPFFPRSQGEAFITTGWDSSGFVYSLRSVSVTRDLLFCSGSVNVRIIINKENACY